MRIALIDGSPKFKESGSGKLLAFVKAAAMEAGVTDFVEVAFRKAVAPTEEQLNVLSEADAWVFAYPLYVDGMPGHLLGVLRHLEAANLCNENRKIYGICNCGFYEGEQNEPALDVLRNWTAKCGYIWGGAVGVGGGGATTSLSSMGGFGRFLMGSVKGALKSLGVAAATGKTQENCYISILLPRFIYTICAHDGWKKKIKAAGGKVEDLERRF
ncbi:MAG: NAD(P)H-dependent oxidoreductase [Firmicutes bacterium]|nr:NAD(P)H-dependent oxidoreductase [Bacillota bacterium]